jgi:hypothetical protein
MIRNRIVEHVQVRAGDLVPHPLNYRRHPERQRRVLAASYEEVGFARSLLGYRRSDGKIQLIDGHLRRDLDPDMTVTVEVLDVSDEEARKLLLTIDPLAALADHDGDMLQKLAETTRADSQALNDLWQSMRAGDEETLKKLEEPKVLPEQYLVLVECRDEQQQVELLERFTAAGLKCRALLS